MKDVIEIPKPFTEENLEFGYNGSNMLKCGDWYIKISKNRGRIPWIVMMGRYIKDDKEFNLGLLIDQEKENAYTNDYSAGAVQFINDVINGNRQTKIATKIARESRMAKKIFCEFTNK